MDESIRVSAELVRSSLPCSIELAAGTGKTQVVAALAALALERGERALILTHTNAGVEALRCRLRDFGVQGSSVRVDTIASWSFSLVRRYPLLSGLTVGCLPEWSRSKEYYGGAARAVRTRAMRRMLEASYEFVVVDEYQDCVIEQHDLVLAIQESLPVCVFGDPLQNVFNFKDNVTVKWAINVIPTWPAVTLPVFPWRWHGHNEQLGK
jgi:superfamily I DNA/RNA helicase